MEAFLEYIITISEYIMANYTWILGGSIIILLAIIGSYADKTNFGQGKSKSFDDENDELNRTDEINILDRPINEVLNFNNDENKSLDEESQENLSLETNDGIFELEDKMVQTVEPQTNEQLKEKDEDIKSKSSFDDSFDEFDREFNELLPEKEIINDELLEEIEGLTLDKTQKIDLTDIPDLNEVELPKIKSLELEQEDVWKF